ncbi:MAG: DUF58 domain-containing protein [Gemmataceae bacterium]
MLPREVIRQIRRLQIQARRAVEDLLGGEYHSVFKGAGIAFEEVRAYQPGDDIRTIDWNVTARMGQPFIKRFVEERELTVVLLIDCSASHQFGTQFQRKREVAAELAALIAFTAVSNNDRVGLVQFTDEVERFVPPRKGSRHVLRLIRDVLYFQPKRTATCLRAGLDYLNRVLHRRSIVFLISDFLDEDFEQALKRAGRRHDLIAIKITDPREEDLPAVGFLELQDAETGRRILLDTNSRALREEFRRTALRVAQSVRQAARTAHVDLIDVSTTGGHLDALIRFFKMRERRLRRT